MRCNTHAEAKIAIKQLRLIKKEFQAQKRELAAVKAEENARWREVRAGRYPGMRGNRGFGMLVQGKRRGERMQHADRVNEVTREQTAFDLKMLKIDGLIAQLEAYLLTDE